MQRLSGEELRAWTILSPLIATSLTIFHLALLVLCSDLDRRSHIALNGFICLFSALEQCLCHNRFCLEALETCNQLVLKLFRCTYQPERRDEYQV
jgi:hypothetical protein